MIASRYGTVPVVRETGGLNDSIKAYTGVKGNGFTFADYNAHDMLYVINDDGTISMNLDNFDLEGNLRTNGELSTLLNTFSDNIGKSIWSQLLENEELMRLGRYYQAFISRNGVTGEWGKYWALLDPG
jgi:hypothetical protein